MQGSLLMFFCAFSKSSLENQAQWIKHSQTYQRMFSKGFVKRNQTSKRFLYFRSSFMISIPRRCGCKDVDLSDPYLEDDPQYLVIRGSSAHGDRFRSLRIVGCGTTSKWQFTPWLINRGDRGDPNHLQVLGWSFKYEMLFPKVKSKALPCQAPPSPYSMQRCWHSAPWKRTKKQKGCVGCEHFAWVMCRIRPHSIVSCVFDVLISAFRLKDWLFKSTFKLDPSPMISGSFSNLEIMPASACEMNSYPPWN